MPRSERHNPYQLPFDFSAQPLEIGQHVRVVKEPYVIRQPADAAQYLVNQIFVPFAQFRQEQLYVLLLDIRHTITHDVMAYKGTVNSMNIRVAELFMEAIKVNAPSIILSHVHPSGAIEPSPEDVQVTEMAYEASQLLNISLMDHIIVGKNQWVSLKEHGIGFP